MFGIAFELSDPNQIIMKSRIAHRSDKPSKPQFLPGSTAGYFSSSEITSMFGSIEVENEAKQENTNATTSADNEDQTGSNADERPSTVNNCADIAADFLQMAKFMAQHRLESMAESYVKTLFVTTY